MAWMIVKTGGTYRRPRSVYSFTFSASVDPQEWPQDVVAYAVSKGWAEHAEPPARAIAAKHRAARRKRT